MRPQNGPLNTKPVVAEALLTAQPSSELDPNGQIVTIHGSGFDASADAPAYLPVNKAGFYVQIGWIDENWRPSEGAPSSARSNAYSVWVQDTNGDDPYMLWEEAEDGTASFTWEIEIDKATLDEKQREGAQLAVFTTPAGGTQQPMNETMIPISFADEAELPDPDDSESPEPGDTESPEPGSLKLLSQARLKHLNQASLKLLSQATLSLQSPVRMSLRKQGILSLLNQARLSLHRLTL